MASIARDPGGQKRILFVAPDGRRKVIRMGKMPLADARTVKHRIESLLASKISGHPLDNETAKWVRDIPDVLAGKLARAGLIAERNAMTIDGLTQAFLAANPQAKPATLVVWGQVARDLRKHFGEECPLRSIGRIEAEGFRQGLIQRKLAATTIHKRLQFTRQIFAYAIRFDWIEKNPFEGVKHKGGDPRKRQHYVAVEDTQKLIDAAPNWVWRTIIALARHGGLRCPSEVLSLRLADLDWERGAVKVISPKTEGHGQGIRIIPMFAQLRPQLEEAWEMAEEGQIHVIPEHLYLPAANGPRGWNGCNLRTTLQKIVDRAGLEPWPRLFHNLRASCESDLAREYPITTVCKWLGNTVSIAARHYIQVTDSDFQKAAQNGETTAQQVAQKAAQSGHEKHCNGLHKKQQNLAFPEEYEALRTCTYVPVETSGLEPPTPGLQSRCSPS